MCAVCVFQKGIFMLTSEMTKTKLISNDLIKSSKQSEDSRHPRLNQMFSPNMAGFGDN